ncbi:MAG: hypothetical protein HUK22_07070, partial [Thermoguttaceae bacterium]|nr:hypothetical protein [Thermoguttaceae bacterium]
MQIAVVQFAPSVSAYAPSEYEVIVYGPTVELNDKVDGFFKAILEDGDYNKAAAKMKLFVIPEKSRYLRDRVVLIVNSNFERIGASAYPGALANQVIVWGLDSALEQITQFLDELLAAPDEAVYQTYPISNVTVETAMAFLAKVCPNVELSPDVPRKAVIAFGTPLQHASIAEALKVIDSPTDPAVVPVVKTYYWEDPNSFWSVYTELTATFPTVVLTVNAASYEYVVATNEETHAKLKSFLDERVEGWKKRAPVFKSYALTRVSYTKVVQISPAILPAVGVYPGKTANELFVVATPPNHERFAELLSKLESLETTEAANAGISPKIYSASGQAAANFVQLLAPAIPGAVIYALSGNRFIVWGSAEDHAYIEKNIETFVEAFPNIELKKYSLHYLRYQDVYTFMMQRFPAEVTIYPASDGNLMVVANPVVQEEFAKILSEMDVEEAAETRAIPVAYDIGEIPVGSHPYVSQSIARVAPEAVQLPTSTPGFLVVLARPAVHEKIAELMEEMLKERPHAKQSLVAYSVRRMTLPQLTQLLLPLYPNIKIGAGTTANQIIILAKPEEHEKIKALVEQLNAETDDGMTSRVFRLKNSQLAVASQAVVTMYPQATVVMDQASRSLMVKAYADELDKIGQLMTEIDEKDPERNSSFRVFNIGSLNFTRLLASLRNFYANDPAFQVQLDSTNECLLVRGTAIQHKAVEELIEEVRAGGLADPDAYMQSYTMKNQSALSSLYSVFFEQGRDVNMYRDYSTGKLIVIGRPEEHKLVQTILDVVAPEETELAVFDLVYVDPSSARQVFGMMETDGAYVDARFDASSNQLFVRSTPTKLEEIRRVLIKMGERGLEKMKPFAEVSKGGGSSTDGKRVYIRDGEVREAAPESSSLDLNKLEPIDVKA